MITHGQRANEEWLSDLACDRSQLRREAALGDLRTLILRALRHSFPQCDAASIEDFTQEAILRITLRLTEFRGDSRFETWAISVAIRIAISQLRRAQWRDVSLDCMVENGRLFPAAPDAGASRLESAQLMTVVANAIRQDLTPKQRQAVEAELGGAPPEEIARRMGASRNAVYKLVYDARARLRQSILKAGWTEEHVRGILAREQ